MFLMAPLRHDTPGWQITVVICQRHFELEGFLSLSRSALFIMAMNVYGHESSGFGGGFVLVSGAEQPVLSL